MKTIINLLIKINYPADIANLINEFCRNYYITIKSSMLINPTKFSLFNHVHYWFRQMSTDTKLNYLFYLESKLDSKYIEERRKDLALINYKTKYAAIDNKTLLCITFSKKYLDELILHEKKSNDTYDYYSIGYLKNDYIIHNKKKNYLISFIDYLEDFFPMENFNHYQYDELADYINATKDPSFKICYFDNHEHIVRMQTVDAISSRTSKTFGFYIASKDMTNMRTMS